jgi:hypothetical protein
VLDRKAVEALRAVALEEVEDLPLGKRVPVLVVEKLDVVSGGPPAGVRR